MLLSLSLIVGLLIEISSASLQTTPQPKYCKYEICIPQGYNPQALPPKLPVRVNLQVINMNLRAVMDSEYYIKIDIDLQMTWDDPRLMVNKATNHSSKINPIGYDFGKLLWEPDLHISDLKNGKINRLLEIYRGKTI